jgi:hypothetical protein
VSELAIRSHADVAAASAESLLAFSREARQHVEDVQDLDQCLDLNAILAAVEKRLRQMGQDRRDAEAGQTEYLMRGGVILGPAEHGGDRRSEDFKSLDGDLNRQLRWIMRRLAANAQQVQLWIAGAEKSSVKPSAILRYLKQMEEESRLADSPEAPPQPDIRLGDFRTALADVEPGTVDLILTDPPYAAASVWLYDELGEWAAKVLKPGGSLVCYAGQSMLPEILFAMREHLRYWWMFAVPHHHGGQQLPGKWVICEWKPVLWFVREHRAGRSYIGDRLQGSRPLKVEHDWAQGLGEVFYLVSQLTEPGQLVIDPFAGSGTFGYAALQLDRRFIGADLGREVS